ncbi:agamous-like MADS-box protein AGL80 [Impatiens glandulifera]|uniref:agamous-like MADS-box protein AGL80 n=1 Tax=Impatiens glandulifera TaxID=253017 RepID=UPI001FB11A45|nr:agamous-like MADS-box protein AGL80 [Impatiens glandulifera]
MATLKKRKKGLMKKMDELSTLCGVEGCAIVYSQGEAIPEVWPNETKAESVVARFNMMPNENRHKGMENQEKETTLLMYGYLNGEVSHERKLEMDEYHDLNRVIDQKLEEIGERMRALPVKSTLSLVQDSINPSRVNEDVAECSTSRMRLKDDEFVIRTEENDD